MPYKKLNKGVYFHLKKCSPFLAIKEIQIKTTLRFSCTPFRMATTKNTTKVGGMWEKRNPHTLLVGM
jgi:hypothetical protein